MYIQLSKIKKKNKKKTNSNVLPSGGLFLLMGLNSALSSPTSEQVCVKGVGGESAWTVVPVSVVRL